MSKANVIFKFEGTNVKIQCSPEDKMRDICLSYGTKIWAKLNSLLFLYELNKFELSFKDQVNSIDGENN